MTGVYLGGDSFAIEVRTALREGFEQVYKVECILGVTGLINDFLRSRTLSNVEL